MRGASLPGPRLAAVLLLAALAACGNGPPPEPVLAFSAAATPLEPIGAYGQVVPFRFTVTNDGDAEVELARVDAYAGHRWEMARGLGPLLPTGSASFEIPYRVIDADEQLLLTLRLPGSGRVAEVGAVAKIPCPPAPFDPRFREVKKEGWTYSTALDGFVVRLSHRECQLRRENEVVPLPPLPFGLLTAVDVLGAVRVRDERGRVDTVTAESLAAYLTGVLERRRRIVDSSDPDGVAYEIRD